MAYMRSAGAASGNPEWSSQEADSRIQLIRRGIGEIALPNGVASDEASAPTISPLMSARVAIGRRVSSYSKRFARARTACLYGGVLVFHARTVDEPALQPHRCTPRRSPPSVRGVLAEI